jgi:hypothetical protein
MCARCRFLETDQMRDRGHSMEYGDGQPDDFCWTCGETGAQITAEAEEARLSDLKFARETGQNTALL